MKEEAGGRGGGVVLVDGSVTLLEHSPGTARLTGNPRRFLLGFALKKIDGRGGAIVSARLEPTSRKKRQTKRHPKDIGLCCY